MLDEDRKRWLATSAAVVMAAAAGFGVARITAPEPPSPPAALTPQGPATLTLEQKEISAAGIVVEAVSTGNLGAEILAPAVTAGLPNAQAALTAHAAGTIIRLNKRLGDPVEKGEVLAVVDSKDAAAITADRASADARLALARQIAAQEKSLFDQGATSKRTLETAQASLAAAEAEARRARNAVSSASVAVDGRSVSVISPLSGRITAQQAALGAFIQPETELFRVADPRFVQAEAHLTALDAAKVSPGDGATLLLPGGGTAATKVRSITPALDPQTRTKTVVIAIPDGVSLAPGETFQARVMPKGASGKHIVVSEEAVQRIDGRSSVFVKTQNGFVVRSVTVESRGSGRAAITSGLKAGEQVATRNAFLLKAELGKSSGDEE